MGNSLENSLKNNIKLYKDYILFGCISVFIGIVVGAIDTCFGKVLILITDFRGHHVKILLPFLALSGLLITFAYNKFGKNSIKGMTLVFETAQHKEEKIPMRLIPLTIMSTWITHLFGGSAGREGVAVQIGATFAHRIGRMVKIKNSEKILLITGMAAGFGGLFQTPIAAVFFALEVLSVGILEYNALFSALIAAFTASCTSHMLGLEKFTFNLNTNISIDGSFIFKLVVIGLIFGIAGGVFSHLLNYLKSTLKIKIKNSYMRIFFIGVFLSVTLLFLYNGRYCGLGTNLISDSFNNNTIYSYDWFLKLLLTVVTLAAGYQGGEVTPLFSIGATLGAFLGTAFNMPVTFIAALGYAAVFGSASNTFLAPIFIGAEVFGFEYMPYFFIVCAVAYIFNGNKSIYTAQSVERIFNS